MIETNDNANIVPYASMWSNLKFANWNKLGTKD